jgi:hypothetical protein
MKNFYFPLLILMFSFGATAQIVNIPDANFKAKLLSSDITNTVAQDENDNDIKIDANNNGEIEVSEALAVHKLFYTYDGAPPFRLSANNTQIIGPISDLTGIAAFANLKYLYVGSNELTTADLSGNTLLEYLYCGNNLLTSINLDGLIHLNSLNIRDNFFTSFSTAGLPALAGFNCQGNPIQTLTFNNNAVLQTVICQVCELTSLDVSMLPALKTLECGVNEITEINFGSINQVTNLGCSSNLLSTLDISNMTQLKTLNCHNNMLTTNFDFSNMPEMIGVNCDYNLITSLLFSNNPQLHTVSCSNNNLSSLDFSTTSLYDLYASNNPNLSFVNVKNGVITADVYVSQFPEPPFVRDNFQLQNTALAYICHDEGEFGTTLVANQQLGSISRGSYCSFTPGGNYNTITGNIRFDCGGINVPISNQSVNVSSNLQSGTTFSNNNGLYQFYSDADALTVTPQFPNSNYFSVTPANYSFSFADFGNTEAADFCITANGVHPDLEVSILPLTTARPGFDARYKIIYTNKGNQVQSGVVTLTFDDTILDFVTATPIVNSQSANNLTWDFINLLPYESHEIEVTINLNAPMETPPVNNGDYLNYQVNILSAQTDETPSDNHVDYDQEVVGSFDPNDKDVVEGWSISHDEIDNYLHYIVRFQNTGAVPAENVVVKDILSNNLDWTTLQMVSSSHPYRSTLTLGNKLEFFFEGIDLPASSVDEQGSHGYIAFKIKPKSTVVVDDTFENKADIYFDFNFPITTNTVMTIFGPVLGTPTNEERLFRIYPNPAFDVVNIQMSGNQKISKTTINNLLGQTILTFGSNTAIDISSLSKDVYFVTVETDSGRATQNIIKQ